MSVGSVLAIGSLARTRTRCVKKARERLIRLAHRHPEWVWGYADEVWWSRLAQPGRHSWTESEPLRLIEHTGDKKDKDRQAVCCYGMLRADTEKVSLRFICGRPVSGLTTKFLEWICHRLGKEGKKALLLVWDNASWHLPQAVRIWMRAHNRKAKQEGGVRIIGYQLPTKSPWLNRIEPYG